MIKLMLEGLDADGDGTVSLDEFINMMEPVVRRAENVETPESVSRRIFKVLDSAGDGVVTTGEFLSVLKKVGVDMSYDEVRDLFSEYDESHDGCMNHEEFAVMMSQQL